MMQALCDKTRREELRRAAAAGLKIEFRRTKAELILAPAQGAEGEPGPRLQVETKFQGPDRGIWKHSTSSEDAVHSEEREVVLSFPLGKEFVGGYEFHCTGTDGKGPMLKIMRGEKVVGDIFLPKPRGDGGTIYTFNGKTVAYSGGERVNDAKNGAKISLLLIRTTEKGEFVVRINVEKNQ